MPLKGVQGSEFTKDEMSRAKSTATMHATNAQTLKDKGYMTAGEGTDHIGKAYAAIGRGDSKAAALHAQNAIDTIKSGVEPAGASDLHQEIRRQGHNILSHVKEFSPKA
jgi:arylsulfatase A-like enzyme